MWCFCRHMALSNAEADNALMLKGPKASVTESSTIKALPALPFHSPEE